MRTVCDVHPNDWDGAMLAQQYGLLGVVEKPSAEGGDGAVLVRELAREIIPTLKPALKPSGFARSKVPGAGSIDLVYVITTVIQNHLGACTEKNETHSLRSEFDSASECQCD